MSWELKKLLHPAPYYILMGIGRESILISSPPCSLIGIQWNHSIGESRSKLKNQRAELSKQGLYI
jgi:hypothetical protein